MTTECLVEEQLQLNELTGLLEIKNEATLNKRQTKKV